MATPVSGAFPPAGTTVGGLDAPIAGLAQGGAWTFGSGARVLTYALHDLNFGEVVQDWTPTRVATIAPAFAAWAAVADIRFTRIAATGDIARSPADLGLAFQSFGQTSAQGGEIAGFGLFPDPTYVRGTLLPQSGETLSDYPHPEGDIYFNIADPANCPPDKPDTPANDAGVCSGHPALRDVQVRRDGDCGIVRDRVALIGRSEDLHDEILRA